MDDSLIQILHLEDNLIDAKLISSMLEEAGIACSIKRVETKEGFTECLANEKFDLILSDFSLPTFDGRSALKYVQENYRETPFIFVSGTIGEDFAIDSLLGGATDYVLKTKLSRLVPAVSRAIKEAEEKKKLEDTERQRVLAQESLKMSEARFRGFLEAAADAMVIINENGTITFANEAISKVFGFKREEVIDKPIALLIPERFRAAHDGHVDHFMAHLKSRGMGEGLDIYAIRKDGTEFAADIVLSPLKMEDGAAVLAIVRDITALKRAEAALKESEKTYRLLFAANPIPMFIYDTTTFKYLEVNDAAVEHYGYSREEFLSMTVNDIHPLEELPLLLDDSFNLENSGAQKRSWRHRKKDGTRIEVEVIANHVVINGRERVLVLANDITERNRAVNALRESEEQYRSLVDGVGDAIFSLSPNGVIQSLNLAFETMSGWKREEWLNRSFMDLIEPSERNRVIQMFTKASRGEHSGVEQYKLLRKAGDYLIGEFSITSRIQNGRSPAFMGIVRDVTAERNLEMQLRQAQKMESLGTLAGGIAHDFNNLLGIIVAYSDIIKQKEDDPEVFNKSLVAIRAASERGVGLVRQLLTFARKEERDLGPVDLNELIEEVCQLVSETFPKVISIRTDLRKNLAMIVADRSQIHQALLNLCVNARDAMRNRGDGKIDGGTLTIKTAVVPGYLLGEKFPKIGSDEYVAFSVTDTGSGMDEATQSRIFEPFFTTKETGKGTGLGLASVYGIVKGHGGFVDVSSNLGIGSTFTVYLPAQSVTAEENLVMKKEQPEVKGGTETILIVEDEEMLRDILERVLTRKGYKVLSAEDGEEALRIFSKEREIDLVVSDLGLPKVGGTDVIKEMRNTRPDLKAIFASGFVNPDEKEEVTQKKLTHFIQKPFRVNEILRLVRQVLDQTTTTDGSFETH